jgi:hypothetical protein
LEDVSEGGKALAGRADISKARQEGDAAVVEVGSGNICLRVGIERRNRIRALLRTEQDCGFRRGRGGSTGSVLWR